MICSLLYDKKLKRSWQKLANYENLEEKAINEQYADLVTIFKRYCAFVDDMAELAEFRVKREQGRLIELPCAIGSTIYKFKYPTFTNDKGEEFVTMDIKRATIVKDKFSLTKLYQMGIIYFITLEEAERKLEEMKNDRNCK